MPPGQAQTSTQVAGAVVAGLALLWASSQDAVAGTVTAPGAGVGAGQAFLLELLRPGTGTRPAVRARWQRAVKWLPAGRGRPRLPDKPHDAGARSVGRSAMSALPEPVVSDARPGPAPTGPPLAPEADRKRLVSPRLVGRSEVLRRLVAAVVAAPAAVVVEGEAGIGKTRLIRELPAMPELTGRRFLAGSCRRIRDPFPLGPLLEAVRGLGGELARMRLTPVAGALRPLLPELAAGLPPLPEPLDDRDAERHRVFRGLVELLAATGPAVVVLEDLHWADRHTIDFVSYLLGEPPPELSLVLTYRDDEVAAGIRALTAKLSASVTRAHLVLDPLDAEQTAALVAAILDPQPVPAGLAGQVFAQTAGSPFVVEELLALLRARGALVRESPGWAYRDPGDHGVPGGVRDLILERLARLSGTAHPVVEAAAVLQVPVPVPVLVSTCRSAPGRAGRGLEEALLARLLVEHGEAVGFRHVLGAQAVYDSLPGPRRQDLHRRAAAALAGLPEPPLGQLAHHLRAAGQVGEWVQAAERAADRAVGVGHDDEAARLLEDVLRRAPLDRDRLGRLAVKLGRASSEAPQGGPDRATLLSELVDRDLPAVVRGELRFWLVVQLEQVGEDDLGTWRRLLAKAVEELDDLPDLKARATVALGTPTPGLPRAEHRRWLDRAIDMLPMVADPRVRSLVAGKAAATLVRVGSASGRDLVDRLVAQTGGAARHRAEIRAYLSVGSALTETGHPEAAERLLTVARDGAARCASAPLELRAEAALALVRYDRGAWDELATAAATPDRLRHDAPARHSLYVVAGCLELARGDLDAAYRRLHDALRQLDQLGVAHDRALPTVALIRIALGRGDLDAAAAVCQQFVAAMESVPFHVEAVRALPAVTEAMVAAGQPAEARALVARWTRRLRGLDAPLAAPALPHARGFLARAAGRWSAAAAAFGTAADRYERRGYAYEAAQAREQAAVVALDAPGDSAQARGRDLLRSALATYRRLGATWDAARAARAARSRGVAVPARHRGGRRGYGDEMSPREREVAALIATGRTNKEIAAELFVSVKTIEWHVSSLMRKLGVTSRWLVASRLAEPAPAAQQ